MEYVSLVTTTAEPTNKKINFSDIFAIILSVCGHYLDASLE